MDQLNAALDQLSGHDLAWLQERRLQAMNHYIDTGLPGRKHEEWRYTQVRDIENYGFKPVTAPTPIDTGTILSQQIPDALVLVFVDGIFQPGLSTLDRTAMPVTVINLADALLEHGDLVQSYLDSINRNHHGFSYLNTAFFNDGVFVHIPESMTVQVPIQLIHIGSATDAMISSRNLIVAERHARCHLIEQWAGNDNPRLCNSMTEIIARDHANIVFDKLQNEGKNSHHISSTWTQLSAHAQLTHRNFNFGGQLVRNDIDTLLGQHANCDHSGLTVTDQSRHVDNHLRIEHQQPEANSRVLYKNIADGRSRAVFQGRIVVHKDAQQTDSEMSNPNLLLSEDAIIDTKPQLEIDADDVKCAHGVTVGELDSSALFFLRSRGIDELTARNILTFAFANELIQEIDSDELKTMVLNKLLDYFPQSSIRVDWL